MATPPPRADQAAMERVRAGPDQSAVMSASVVGYAMPAERPPTTRARTRTSVDASTSSRAGTVIMMPRTIICLRRLSVAQGSEPQNRGSQAEGVAHGDEVERCLGRVERCTDGGQRDIRDRKVQVGDRRDEDQRPEDDLGVGRNAALGRSDPGAQSSGASLGRSRAQADSSRTGSRRPSGTASPDSGKTVATSQAMVTQARRMSPG